MLYDPVKRLSNNRHIALKIYQQQTRKLNNNPEDKKDVIQSEAKLQSLGFVDYLHNLSPEQLTMLNQSSVQNYIPWRAVWNKNSLSTPCRTVFDASHPTPTGYSLFTQGKQTTSIQQGASYLLVRS